MSESELREYLRNRGHDPYYHGAWAGFVGVMLPSWGYTTALVRWEWFKRGWEACYGQGPDE